MKEITLEEFTKQRKRTEELKKLGITLFSEPLRRWMQKTAKYYMRNVFNLGVWQVNWDKIVK